MPRILRILAAALVLVACGPEPAPQPEPLDLTARLAPGETRAGIVEDPAALIGGPKADGLPGDVKIYNAKVAYVIEGVRRASGYRFWGGNVADADVVRDGEGQDRFGEIFFAWNLSIFRPESLEILEDGRAGPARVRFKGRTEPFALADGFIGDLLNSPPAELAVTYDYILEPDLDRLGLAITLTNDGPEPVEVKHPFALANLGDGAQTYVPGTGFAESLSSAYLPYVGAVGREVSYALIAEGDDLVPLFGYSAVNLITQETFTVGAGRSVKLGYQLAVAAGGSAGIDEARLAVHGGEVTARLAVTVEVPEATSHAWAAVRDARNEVVGVMPVVDGGFSLPLDPGVYTVEAFAKGCAPTGPVAVTIAPGATASASLRIEAPALVTSRVRDPSGAPVPARVTFLREGATPSPFAPGAVRFGAELGGAVSAYAYVTGESDQVLLPAGRYRAVAGRGFSYELDSQSFEVAAGDRRELAFTIEKVIDTTGWSSSDFHIHALRSPDSEVPYDVRARQLVTEDLDAPILTEHVVAAGLGPTLSALGLQELAAGVAGQEVTTFAYGHFNAFPLLWDTSKPNWGAVEEHGRTPAQLFEDIRAQNPDEEVVQVNHPRGGTGAGSYFDYVGLDALADTVVLPEAWSLNWDTIEVFNGGCGGAENEAALADWVGLTNRGYGKTLSSGSDTHGEGRPPGTPRNWIAVEKGQVLADHQSLVPAVRGRRLFVSCGPFVRFEAEDGTGLGGRAAVDAGGKVRLRAKVEAPGWIRLLEVRLLENGDPVETLDVSAATAVVRLDTTFEVAPAEDAWYALEVRGTGSLAPVGSGVPYALTNPIEIDADGDGDWTPPLR